jgi:hypothetical protein
MHIVLDPLDVRQVQEALSLRLRMPVSYEVARTVHEATGGVPLLVNTIANRLAAAPAGQRRLSDALDALSREHGAVLRYEHRVLGIEPGEDRVAVTAETPAGETAVYEAEGVVVTAGAWSAQLLAGLVELPRLRVTEEHPAHFTARPEFASAEWPSFNHFQPDERLTGYRGNLYGMLTPGEGIKVGFHATGDEVDPDHRRFRSPDAARAQLREHVAHWFPGLDPDSAVEISCTYTLTPLGAVRARDPRPRHRRRRLLGPGLQVRAGDRARARRRDARDRAAARGVQARVARGVSPEGDGCRIFGSPRSCGWNYLDAGAGKGRAE